jgi:hypothetical protein
MNRVIDLAGSVKGNFPAVHIAYVLALLDFIFSTW